jgi:hypothetical protein
MTLIFALLSILLAFIGAAYLQLPTFILALGYGWSHHMEVKRWILRILALGAFCIFLSTQPLIGEMVLTIVPFGFFLGLSLVNSNTNIFRELYAGHILKSTENNLGPTDEVVGYINERNQAICYPIEAMIKPRHLLNDVFENEKILISFCAACRSSIVYSRILEGQELNFQVIGVYRRNMIMRDKETGTIWQQGTGEAVYGRLKGKQLTLLPYQQMTAGEWLKCYPGSLIATESADAPTGLFPRARLVKMLAVTERLVAPGNTSLEGLALRERVWGLEINGKSKAYPISELKKISIIADQLGEIPIEIHYTSSSNLISGKEVGTGKALKFQSHWWLGWKEFHPHTEIWRAQ